MTKVLSTDAHGLLRNETGMLHIELADFFTTAEGYSADRSWIICRLALETKQPNRKGVVVPLEDARQLWIPVQRARAMAEEIIQLADQIEGKGAQRQ